MSDYAALLVPAIAAVLGVIYVLPWHVRLRNVATLSMSFWLITQNIRNIVNCKFVLEAFWIHVTA